MRRRLSGAPLGVSRAIALFLAVTVAACSETPAEDERPRTPADRTDDTPASSGEPEPEAEALRAELIEHFTLIQAGRTGPARVRLRKIVDADETDGHAAFLFGLTYHVEKRYAKALPWFQRAGGAAPNLAPVAYFEGWALYYLGRLQESRRAFERHAALAPEEHDTQFALGLIALDEGRLDEAEQRFDAALALAGSDAATARDRSKALARRAQVAQALGEPDRARADLERACAEYPDHYEAHYMLFRLLTRLGEDDAAEAARRAFVAAQRRVSG